MNKDDVTDAYVEVRIANTSLARTNVVLNSLNPKWNESYRLDVCHTDEVLKFCVLDKDNFTSEEIGNVEFKVEDLLDGQKREGEYRILKKRHVRSRGKLHLMVKFVPYFEKKRSLEVDSYFPVHNGCHVTLYQDAHIEPNMEQFENMNPKYVPRSCWTDVYLSLKQATELIVVVGWSVWHELKLIRQKQGELCVEDRNLGEILLAKAKDGVKVYIMIWEEYTGGAVGDTMGTSMGTHGTDTFNFCENAGLDNLKCVLVPRTKRPSDFGSFGDDWFVDKFQNTSYTHHQKTIICDASSYRSTLRRLVAYVGGLDLTNGRYDTPNHELFSTLQHEHKGDIRRAMMPPRILNIDNQGPRQPWHDIHCKVEGKIAYDVFINFRERWEKQGKKDAHIHNITELLDINADGTSDENNSWSCQLFRSINEDSAIFDQSRAVRYSKSHQTLINKLSRKSGCATDSSIMQAYVQIIRNAEKFIYIENQYFLGSSYCWECHGSEQQIPNTSCQHIVPAEITQKVVEKIQKGSHFVAYILVPMFPEGDPTSAVVQEILHWQFRTMEMMYKKISLAIAEAESDTVPTDWLVFMCLGKKEFAGQRPATLDEPTNQFSKNLHFPIYVHSKLMIVDDVYIIVGSANINQRSMAGSRDTEIAVGSWQPNFSFDNPRGDVHKFRLGLFCEHFNYFDEIFISPSSMQCVRKIKDIIRCNWASYTGELFDPNVNFAAVKGKSHGNILQYPIEVRSDGSLKTLNDQENFPNYPPQATIKGKISLNLPQILTS